MTGFMIGGMIFVSCIVGLVCKYYDNKGSDESDSLDELEDEILYEDNGIGVVEVTDDSITFIDYLAKCRRKVSEPVLQFVQEVKSRPNTFTLKVPPEEQQYSYNDCTYVDDDYTLEDKVTGKVFVFETRDIIFNNRYSGKYIELIGEHNWLTFDEKRYLYLELFDGFYKSRKNKLKDLQNKRIRNNMKRIYRKEEK